MNTQRGLSKLTLAGLAGGLLVPIVGIAIAMLLFFRDRRLEAAAVLAASAIGVSLYFVLKIV